MRKPWFKSKNYGYGWRPATWQGWLILILFLILILANFFRIDAINHSISDLLANFIPQTVIMILALALISSITGEKAHWRWGNSMTLVYTTFPNAKDAKKICTKLIEEKLIACANFNTIDSHYIWEEKIMSSQEVAVFLKTTNWNFRSLKRRLIELHPYERVFIFKIKGETNHSYFEWLVQNTL